MAIKHSKNTNEICYPFIFETSWLCDFEVTTDELCALIGGALAAMPNNMPDLVQDLEQLQPLAFHVNGSIRGQLAITEADITWLNERLTHYQAEIASRANSFVLPRGDAPIPQLHLARSSAKKAIRVLVRIDQEGKNIPEVLPRMCNLMCNFFFTLTLVINHRRGITEVPFVSKSYPTKKAR